MSKVVTTWLSEAGDLGRAPPAPAPRQTAGGGHGWLAARNLLAVRMDNTGDVVMLGPALRAIKASTGGARVTLLASAAGARAVPLLPWIDAVLTFRASWQELGGPAGDPARDRELVGQLAAGQFDAALIFTSFSQTPHTPAYVCYLAGIPLRAGESKEFGGAVLSTAAPPSPEALHQVERNLRLVEAVGYTAGERALAVALPAAARAAAAERLLALGFDPARPLVLMHPGASAQARRYSAAALGAAARLLGERGVAVLVTGVEGELPLLRQVLAAAPGARAIVGGDLAEYAALIERAALVVCGNTLPLHLADALGTPVLALYAGTDYEAQWRPRAVAHTLLRRPTECYPCYYIACPIGQPCLALAPAEVVAAACRLLALPRGARAAAGRSAGVA